MKTVKVTDQHLFNKVLQLRHDVFVKEQQVDPSIELDHFDTLDNPVVDHFALVIMEDVVIGSCRVLHLDTNTVRLGRFSIHEHCRHQGFGLKFLRNIHDYYYRKKIDNIIIHAQEQAVPFYKAAGYLSFGESYLEADIPHLNMRKPLYQHFYTRFSEVYDLIFPLTVQKEEFLSSFIHDKQSLLDIGCATGEVLRYIKDQNKETLGLDLDQGMIFYAQDKNLNAIVLDMRKLNGLNQTFDGILCLGNTLVHLDNFEEVHQFFNDCYNKLNPDGELAIQIVNYHKILSQNVSSLPTIYSENRNVSLERNYVIQSDYIKFNTILSMGKKKYPNTIRLIPMTESQLIAIALDNMFKVQEVYGSYKKDPFLENESDHLIVILKK